MKIENSEGEEEWMSRGCTPEMWGGIEHSELKVEEVLPSGGVEMFSPSQLTMRHAILMVLR